MSKEIPQSDENRKIDDSQETEVLFPEKVEIVGNKALDLRYGENPDQKATLYFDPNSDTPLMHLNRLAGRELSLVNVTDINAGIESVRLFDDPCTVIIKHNTPSGIDSIP